MINPYECDFTLVTTLTNIAYHTPVKPGIPIPNIFYRFFLFKSRLGMVAKNNTI